MSNRLCGLGVPQRREGCGRDRKTESRLPAHVVRIAGSNIIGQLAQGIDQVLRLLQFGGCKGHRESEGHYRMPQSWRIVWSATFNNPRHEDTDLLEPVFVQQADNLPLRGEGS